MILCIILIYNHVVHGQLQRNLIIFYQIKFFFNGHILLINLMATTWNENLSVISNYNEAKRRYM